MAEPIDEATRDFLRRSMVVMVATCSPKSRPFLTPLWFVLDDGALYITTGASTWAGRNVAQHPEVALLFGGEATTPADRFLRLRGTATCHQGFPPLRVLLRIAAKYYLSPGALAVELRNAAKWGVRMRYYAGVSGGPGYIRVVPTAAAFLSPP